MIDGVKIKQLKVIPDERGRLMEILREDDDIFMRFGQVYLTTGYPGVVKAWHYHKVQNDHFCVVKGMMKVVLYDARDGSPTKGEVNEFFLGEHRPVVLRIPPLVYHGFKTISQEEALLINVSTQVYRHDGPDEFRVHPHENDIPYKWARKDG
ncbi:MAG: dTDP-4-dehydrorhamnose 3,5-epimerase [Deltaproteobacteria bacterium]|jgi:dTDP-4-dehydrorhamnose 3,5-epimerase|nr:dTDP-4-dehydrorhamnose 3,5-epimerase [Deltaproteobacteria bacterium]